MANFSKPANVLLHLVFPILLLSFNLGTANASNRTEVISFEDAEKIPAITSQHGRTSLSSVRAKFGRQSLLWEFSAAGSLTIHQNINFKHFDPTSVKQARHSFMTWIYNERPIDGQLNFQFHTSDELNSSFNVNLKFQGWRAIAIPFETDMQGVPSEQMNKLTISAPETNGSLYFDLMALSIPVDPRWHTPDYQVPFVNKNVTTRANAHWGALLEYDKWQQNFDSKTHPTNARLQKNTIDIIEQRIDDDLLSGSKKPNRKQVTEIINIGNTLTRAEDGSLKPVQMGRQLEVYKYASLEPEQLRKLNQQTVRFQKVANHLYRLAKAYRTSSSKESKTKLRQQFVSILNHVHDQGYVRGSAVGIMHHQGYPMRNWNKAMFLGRTMMNDVELSTSQQSMAWLIGLGRMFRAESNNKGFNVDVMNTFLPGMIMAILMQRDDDSKVAYLHKLSKWMSYSMLATKGLSGGIQPDGSFFHHSQHYVAYGNGGLEGLTPVVYYLSRTPFSLSDQAYHRLKQAILMTRIFSNGLKVPMSLAGRHPEDYAKITLAPFKYLTMMADKEIAAAYFRLIGLEKTKIPNLDIKVEPEKSPNGSWVMNYSSMALHRRDEWLASARGFSRYLVGNETYSNANHFGRYMNYGHLEILPSMTVDSGFSEAGWDWNRWSGTTTVHLPLKQLASNITQVDSYSGIEEMLLSTETFSGGNHLDNNNAMFAMKLRGHDKYDSDLRANKSVFFFDDRIVALGSDISNSERNHTTETTLFQQSIGNDEKSYIGGKAISGSNVSKRVVLAEPNYYFDTRNNAYFVPKEQYVLFERQLQHSLENEQKKPTQGAFTTLVIDHGNAPSQAKYQYSILVNAGQKRASQFFEQLQTGQPPFSVLQHDSSAHIVHDKATNITSYALFDSNNILDDNFVVSNDTPIMLMIQPNENGVKLAVTDPDLNLYQTQEPDQLTSEGKQKEVSIYSRKWRHDQPSSKSVTLTLKGHWRGTGDNYRTLKTTDTTTKLQITPIAATPIQISLIRN